jgi:uncharacterized protein DUF2163
MAKQFSQSLQAHLDSGTTTLAWCWRLTRNDGVVFGFTDHDQPLTFDSTTFEPESGFTASEIRAGSDLSVDAQEAEGVLTSDTITETDTRNHRRGCVQGRDQAEKNMPHDYSVTNFRVLPAQRFRGAANFSCNPRNRSRLVVIVILAFENHPYGPRAHFR